MHMKGEFLTAINMLSNEKGVSPDIVVEALESALVSAYKRNFEDTALNVSARIDPGTGEPKVFVEKTVVDDPAEPHEIDLEAARAIKADAEIGETIWEDVTPKSFGRIAAAADSFEFSLAPALKRYRLAVLDQRGTGRSGALSCPVIQHEDGLAPV